MAGTSAITASGRDDVPGRANTAAAARRDSPAAGRGRPPGPAADNLPGVLCPFYVLDVSPSDTHNQIHKALE